MYAREIYRVNNFLMKDAPYYFPAGNDPNPSLDIIEFARSATWSEMTRLVKKNYIDTRRIKEGADREIEEYFAPLKQVKMSGHLVMQVSYSLRLEDLVTLWIFFHSPERKSAIICTNYERSHWAAKLEKRAEGEYLKLDDVLRSVRVFFDFSEQTVQSAYRVWRRTLNRGDINLVDSGAITPELASSFADALSDSDQQSVDDTEAPIPGQLIAPLRFETSNGLLELLAAREHRPDDGKVRGGALTCISAAEDLREYQGFSNPIPNFDRKLTRIIGILGNIAASEYDDSLVVQLGTEVVGLEARLASSKEHLDGTAFEEASAFFAVAHGYLAQFQVWMNYKQSASLSQIQSEGAFNASRELLSGIANSQGAATAGAQQRIDAFIESLEGAKILLEQEGALLSAENVASQAAAQLAADLKRRKEKRPGDQLLQIDPEELSGLSAWFIANRAQLASLAEANNLPWLTTFLEKLKSQ